MKKAIFWDSDGTLLYNNESFKCSLIRSFKTLGYSLGEEDARRFLRGVCSWYMPEKDHSDKDGEGWWQELLDEISKFCEKQGVEEEHVSTMCSAFREKVISYEYEAYPDAKEVLQYFREKGYENYVISNNFPELNQVFERLGLDTEITGYFMSGAVGYEKPRKEIYEYAMAQAGNPQMKYMVGDNPVADYEGGLLVGMAPILVHNQVEGKVCCETLFELTHIIKD